MLSFGCWNRDEQSSRTVSAKRTEKSTVQWEKSPTGSVGSDSYRLNIVGGGLRGEMEPERSPDEKRLSI